MNEEDLRRLQKKLSIKWFNIIMSHCLDDASKTAKEEVEENIKEGMTRNLGWAPFAPRTVEYKVKKGRPLKGLVDTGKMSKSVTKKHTVKNATVKVGTEYAKYQESGTKYIPARSFLAIVAKLKEQKERVVKSFKKRLDKELKQKWPKSRVA